MADVQWCVFEIITYRSTVDPHNRYKQRHAKQRLRAIGDVWAPDRRAALCVARRQFPGLNLEVQSYASLAIDQG